MSAISSEFLAGSDIELEAREPLIIVIDDDPGVCRALARMLTASGYRVEIYMRPEELLAEADDVEPACVLADIRMPELDGIALSQELRAHGLTAPIVFMTATGDVGTVVRAMKEGATDLLPKPFSADALLAAVSKAIDVNTHTDEENRSLLALWRIVGRLTPREAEVCALVACGSPNKIVAARIGTTEKTVKVHRDRVMSKLAAGSLAELVRMVDRLVATESHTAIRLDGVETARPRTVNIVLDVVKRARGHTGPALTEVPQTVGL